MEKVWKGIPSKYENGINKGVAEKIPLRKAKKIFRLFRMA
jgi:hypothetical protein